MATTAQKFFYSTTEQDFTAAGEVDIRKLTETANASDSTTVTTHASAAGTTIITLDPYTNRSTTGDIRINAGWAINALGADGMVSDGTVSQRRIPAGVWQFTLTVALPTAGTGTGTLTVNFQAAVYRVSATGARTLLFTATSGTGQSTGLAALAATVLTANSASQPEYILAANETLHVGFYSNLVQVAGLAGATVSGVATWTVGTASQFVQVPSPGVRTQYISGASDTITSVNDTLTRVQNSKRSLTETLTVSDSLNRQLVMSRSLTDSVPTTDVLTRSVGLRRGLTEDLATGGGGTTTVINNNIFLSTE